MMDRAEIEIDFDIQEYLRQAADAKRQQYLGWLVNGIVLVVVFLGVVLVVLLGSGAAIPDAVVTYTVSPHKTVLCPEDPLVFDQRVTIKEDAVIRLSAVVVNLDTGRTVQRVDMDLQATIRRAGEEFSPVGRTIQLDNLPVGHYEYRLGAEAIAH